MHTCIFNFTLWTSQVESRSNPVTKEPESKEPESKEPVTKGPYYFKPNK